MNSDSVRLSLPTYDEVEFGKRYAELKAYKVSVPGNLEPLGYMGINDLLGQIQAMMTRTNELLIDAERDFGSAQATALAAKSAFDAKKSALLMSKDRTTFDSFRDLEASVDTELAEDKKLMDRTKLVSGLFSAYLTCVKGTYKNLEHAKRTLQAQNKNYMQLHPPPIGYPSSHGYQSVD